MALGCCLLVVIYDAIRLQDMLQLVQGQAAQLHGLRIRRVTWLLLVDEAAECLRRLAGRHNNNLLPARIAILYDVLQLLVLKDAVDIHSALVNNVELVRVRGGLSLQGIALRQPLPLGKGLTLLVVAGLQISVARLGGRWLLDGLGGFDEVVNVVAVVDAFIHVIIWGNEVSLKLALTVLALRFVAVVQLLNLVLLMQLGV